MRLEQRQGSVDLQQLDFDAGWCQPRRMQNERRWPTSGALLKSVWVSKKSVQLGLVAFFLLSLGTVIFRDFLFRDKLLLYRDIGSDSLNIQYPYFVHFSDYLRANGLPSWSFSVGMGQSLFPYVGSLLFDPVAWLPKHAIAYALVYQHLLKVFICGMLFFRFLELRALNFRAALLGAVLLSLSAYMCMGSCWINIGDEVVCAAFALFAVENALTRGRWFYLPLAVACFGLLSAFHLYLCALLLSLYVSGRLVELYGWKLGLNLRTCLRLAGIALIGVGFAAVVWLDGAANILNSPRGSGLNSYANKLWAFPVFGFEAPKHYLTAILRPFSNDLAGTGNYFRGWQNYLEAPISYCGLLCLLLVPQAFVGAERRQRILYGSLLLLVVAPVVFPWFRYLFWLFQGDYYRTLSLFSIVGTIALSMTALSRYTAQRSLNLWLLGITLLILLSVLYLRIDGIDFRLRKEAALLLLAYAGLLAVGRCLRCESVCTWLIIGLCAAELCYFDRITVAYRPTVTKQELKERIGYNDYTVDAVRDIKAADESFYRITKLYASGTAVHPSIFNDAMVFGYYGTMSYSSFNNLNYIRFLMAVGTIPQNPTELDTRWARGLVGRPVLSTFACEKYIFTPDPVPVEVDPTYESFHRYDKIYVFRNKLFLPFGLFYPRCIPEKMFLELPSPAKERALLRAAVLPDDEAAPDQLPRMSLAELQQSLEGFSLPEVVTAHRGTALRMRSFTQNRIEGTVRCDSSGILVFQTAFDPGWRAFVDGVRTPTFKADVGLLGVKLTPGEHSVEIRYSPPFLRLGAAITALSALILGVSFWRWPRISLPTNQEILPTS